MVCTPPCRFNTEVPVLLWGLFETRQTIDKKADVAGLWWILFKTTISQILRSLWWPCTRLQIITDLYAEWFVSLYSLLDCCFHTGLYLISTKVHDGCNWSADDAYSSTALDPTVAFVGGPCCLKPQSHWIARFWNRATRDKRSKYDQSTWFSLAIAYCDCPAIVVDNHTAGGTLVVRSNKIEKDRTINNLTTSSGDWRLIVQPIVASYDGSHDRSQ
jgi:hypothetical protein